MTQQYSQTASRWLLSQKNNPQSELRLFCFSYAGGAANIFRSWLNALPSTVEVCPIQLPGRGNRLGEQPFTKLEPLVQAASRDLLPYFNKPFAFFGHSMGAIIAFELARFLRNEYGVEPVHLFVSARRAPQLPDRKPSTFNLPQAEFLNELRRLGGTPKEVLENSELIELVLPMLRADFELTQTYTYLAQQPLKCSITAFGGLSDADVKQEDLQEWHEQTSAGFSLKMLSGDHFFLSANQDLLLNILSSELDRIVHNIVFDQHL